MSSPVERTKNDVIQTIASFESGKRKALPYEALPEAVHVESVPYDAIHAEAVTAKPLMEDDYYIDMVIKEIKKLQTIALDRNKENSDLLLLLKEIIEKDPKKNLDTHKKTVDDEFKEFIGDELRAILKELMKKDGSSSTWLKKFIENQASDLIKKVEQLKLDIKRIYTLESTEKSKKKNSDSTEYSNDPVKCFSDKLKYILEIKIMDLSKKDEYPPYLSNLQNKLEQYYGELTRFADKNPNSRETINIIKEFMKKPSSNSKLQEAVECALHVFLVKQLLYGCESTDPEDCNTSQIQSIVYRFYEKISSILKPAELETPVDNRLCHLHTAMFITGNYMSFFDGFDEETVNQTISNPDSKQSEHRTILKIRTIINNSYFKIRECFLEKCCLDEDDRECEDCDSVVNPEHNEPPLSKQRSESPPAPASAPPLLPPTPRAPPPSRSPSPSEDSLNSEDVNITENLLSPGPPSPPPVESDTTREVVSSLSSRQTTRPPTPTTKPPTSPTRPSTSYTSKSTISNSTRTQIQVRGITEESILNTLFYYTKNKKNLIVFDKQKGFWGANYEKSLKNTDPSSKIIYGMLLFEEGGQPKTLLGLWNYDAEKPEEEKTKYNCTWGVVRINDENRPFQYKMIDGKKEDDTTKMPIIENLDEKNRKIYSSKEKYSTIVAKIAEK